MDSTVIRGPATPGSASPTPDEVALQLPFDHAHTPALRHAPACHAFDLHVPVLHGVAPDALFAGIFAVALARYGSQASIPLVMSHLLASGQVLSCSALRLHTDAAATLSDLIAEVARQSTSTAANLASAWAGGGRAAISFIESDLGPAPDILGLLAAAPADLRSAELQCVVTQHAGAHRGVLVYNATRFKAATVARIAGHLQTLLAHALTHRDTPIAHLPLLTPVERDWLAATSTGDERTLPGEFVHQSFEAHCAATPEAIALRWRDQHLTYGQLNRRANQLAHMLRGRGIGIEDHVVVCVEPGIDIGVALLGILKAGAVYVPLDPAYPPARIQAILEDTRPKLVLSRSRLIDRLGLASHACLALDAPADPLEGMATINPSLPVDPRQTASIYYTSGTTGKPKGVMASQANLRAYIQLAQERYAISASDVMPAIARFSFSISMFELMSPLAAGGTLVVLDREHVLDLERLARTLGEVTFFHAGPSLLKNVLAHIEHGHADFSAFAGVRHASSGGDMIAPEILESLKKIFTCAEVFVIYGCSEVSCMGCTYPVPRETTVTRTFVGRPFSNTVVRVLDAALNAVPAGIVGEIYFAGDGVVKGYLNRPELTAEKFITIDAKRFYRTGDMGRLSDDGWLEILGRNDFQINLRGMRIELAEVEVNLRRAPGVRDGVVMAKPAASGEKVLVAYIVPEPDAATAPANANDRVAAVRRHMVANLPDYMVPSHYVELDALPLNHNMKVDRRALPDPVFAQARVAGDARIRQPETVTEARLATIWKQLLGLRQVGLDDNFFGLGGQSLNATQFVARVRAELGVELAGMEVLRESLDVLAALCEQRLNLLPARSARRAAATAPTDRIEIFHFGPGQSLYGVLHRPVASQASKAVLICAPVGQEHVRTHFVLNRFARQLASQGVPAFRFDHFGCGDSLGDAREASLARWMRDIVDAHAELRRRTAATRIVGVGVRLGATLLWNASNRIKLSQLILWDPVMDGAAFHAEMVTMHRRYVRGTQDLRLGRSPHRATGGEELLGMAYSDLALRELKELRIAQQPSNAPLPTRWLITSGSDSQRFTPQSATAAHRSDCIEKLDFDCAWDDVVQMSEVLPDVGISKILAAFAKETS